MPKVLSPEELTTLEDIIDHGYIPEGYQKLFKDLLFCLTQVDLDDLDFSSQVKSAMQVRDDIEEGTDVWKNRKVVVKEVFDPVIMELNPDAGAIYEVGPYDPGKTAQDAKSAKARKRLVQFLELVKEMGCKTEEGWELSAKSEKEIMEKVKIKKSAFYEYKKAVMKETGIVISRKK